MILGPLPQPCSVLLPATPGDLDTYWSGTAPICLGGCKGKHKELKRSQCGNGSCCWLGYKSFCRGTAGGGSLRRGALGMAAGLGAASLGRAGFVPCTRAWSLSSSLVLGPQGEAAWGTHRACPAPWSLPRTHNLSECLPLGCRSVEQAAQSRALAPCKPPCPQ